MQHIRIYTTSNLNGWKDSTSPIDNMSIYVSDSINYWKDSILNFNISFTHFNYDKWLEWNLFYNCVVINNISNRGPPFYSNIENFPPLAITEVLRYGR